MWLVRHIHFIFDGSVVFESMSMVLLLARYMRRKMLKDT